MTSRWPVSRIRTGPQLPLGDVDGDGLLDLYVCNYVEIDLDNYRPVRATDVESGLRLPAGRLPDRVTTSYTATTATALSPTSPEPSGIGSAPPGRRLGVIILDLDGDGLPDIYVANDMMPAYLFHNLGKGKFIEKGMLSGASLMQAGGRRSPAWASPSATSTQRPAFALRHQLSRTSRTMLFLNRGKLSFHDGTHPSGLGPASTNAWLRHRLLRRRPGRQSGRGDRERPRARNAPAHLQVTVRQSAQFFVGEGKGHFAEVIRGRAVLPREAASAAAWRGADYNNDGKPDLVFSNNAGPVVCSRNDTETDNRWLRTGADRRRQEEQSQRDRRLASRSRPAVRNSALGYRRRQLSFRQRPACVVGLGKETKVDRLSVVWPSGKKQEIVNLAIDRGWRLVEGEPEPIQSSQHPRP